MGSGVTGVTFYVKIQTRTAEVFQIDQPILDVVARIMVQAFLGRSHCSVVQTVSRLLSAAAAACGSREIFIVDQTHNIVGRQDSLFVISTDHPPF